MINIALSFSGKKGTGVRIHRQETNGELTEETQEEFINKHKRKKKKPKKTIAIPRGGEGQTMLDGPVRVSKENWLGRLERDPPPKQARVPNLNRNTN